MQNFDHKDHLNTPKNPAFRVKSIQNSSPILGVLQLSNGLVATTSTNESTVSLWDIDQNKVISVLDGHGKPVSSLIELPSSRLVSGSDGEIILWDISKKETPAVIARKKAHGDWVRSLCIINLKTFCSGSRNRILIWDAESLSPLKSLILPGSKGGYIESLVYQDNRLIAGGDGNALLLWDTTEFKNTNPVPVSFPITGSIRDMAIFNNNILACSSYNYIMLLDIETKKLVSKLTGHQGWVRKVINFENKFLISSSDDGTIRFWNVDTQRCFHTINAHTNAVFGLTLNGHCLISGSTDKMMAIWQLSEDYIKYKNYEPPPISSNSAGFYATSPLLSVQTEKKNVTNEQIKTCLIL
jgi:WD40 repeat protein